MTGAEEARDQSGRPPGGEDARERITPGGLLEAIRHRRSFKLPELSPEPIDPSLIDRMLEAANWAPSHGKTEPWRFVVFTGDARGTLGEALGEAYRAVTPAEKFTEPALVATRDRVWKAPVWIALGVEPDPARVEWEELIAFGCAVMNLQLMACALGLGCKWTSASTAVHPLVAETVGFGGGIALKGFLYVGRPVVEWPAGERSPIGEKVCWAGERRP